MKGGDGTRLTTQPGMASEDVDTIYRVQEHAEKAVCAAFGRSKRNAIGIGQSLLNFY